MATSADARYGAQLLARLQHDLRTPLNAILDYAELLVADALDLDEGHLAHELQRIQALARRVLSLVTSLLDPAAVALRRTEAARLRQALQVPLREALAAAQQLQRSATTPEQRSLVPDLQKIRGAAQRLLGLVDDLLLVAQLDAAAWAASASGSHPALSGLRARADRRPLPHAGPTGTLLVVDRDEIGRELLRRRLQRQGYEVEVADDRLPVEAVLGRRAWDLVLVDVSAADLAGLDLLRALRERATPIELPVIAVVQRDDTEDIVESLQLGANDYLSQPIDFPVALARIRTQLSLRRVTRELEQANERLQRYSYLDGLTGIANRRRLDEFVQEEWRRAARTGTPVTLLFADVDRFKDYNDTCGHAAGDDVLRRVAAALAHGVHRAEDLVARYGGEEFAVVLPGVGVEGARVVAERLRQAVAALGIPHPGGPEPYLTISLGTATAPSVWDTTPAELLAAADEALYEAKDAGRNCVRSWPAGPLPPTEVDPATRRRPRRNGSAPR